MWRSSKILCLMAAESRQPEAKWQRKRAHSLPQKPETSLNWYCAAKQLTRDTWPQTNAGRTSLTKNTYCVEEAAQHMTGDRSSRFFSTDTVWNRSANTVLPPWLCPGNILYGWRKTHHSRQWYPLSLQWSPRELNEENVSGIHFQDPAQSAKNVD